MRQNISYTHISNFYNWAEVTVQMQGFDSSNPLTHEIQKNHLEIGGFLLKEN